jgi:cardiolipin synthase A/B
MPGSFWSYFFTIVGTLFLVGMLIMPFTLFVAATIVRQRRSPASSVTWLLTILFMPLIGIPLFWLFGTRKIDRITRNKPPVELTLQDPVGPDAAHPAMTRAAADLGSQGITRGNTLKVHANGEEAYADLITLIDGAQKSISIETYELKGDETGTAIVDRLIARAGAGVDVRLLVDGFGSFYVPRRLLRKLRRAGAKTAFFLPIWRITLLNRSNLRDHRKIAVFDKARVFAGGRNLADEYLGPKPNPKRWADLSFVLEGPATAHYEEIFRYDWAFATREKLLPMPDAPSLPPASGNAVLQVVPSGPDVADDGIFAGMLSFIFAAKQRVWIVTPYFIPTEMLAEALQIGVQRGVDVRVIVPEKSDQVLVDLARGPYLRDLQALGSPPLLYTPSMIHAKAVLIDDAAAAVGSANFDSRSMFLNFEVTSVIHSPAEVRAVEAWIKTLMAETRAMDGKVSRSRDTIEGVARLVTPML